MIRKYPLKVPSGTETARSNDTKLNPTKFEKVSTNEQSVSKDSMETGCAVFVSEVKKEEEVSQEEEDPFHTDVLRSNGSKPNQAQSNPVSNKQNQQTFQQMLNQTTDWKTNHIDTLETNKRLKFNQTIPDLQQSLLIRNAPNQTKRDDVLRLKAKQILPNFQLELLNQSFNISIPRPTQSYKRKHEDEYQANVNKLKEGEFVEGDFIEILGEDAKPEINMIQMGDKAYCSICDFFGDQSNVEEHMGLMHQSQYKEAKNKQKKKRNRNVGIKNVVLKPLTTVSNPAELFLNCVMCDESYPSGKENFLKHMRSKHEVGKFQCGLCGYSSQHQTFLKSHQEKMHSRGDVRNDVQMGHGTWVDKQRVIYEQSIIVEKARKQEKKERINASLQKPYSISFGNMSTTEVPTKLTSHITIPEVFYNCTDCNFRSLDKDALIMHTNMHTNITQTEKLKKYHCVQCNFSCLDKDKMTDHFRNVHTQISLPSVNLQNCQLCPLRFLNSDSLRKHSLKQHKSQLSNSLVKLQSLTFKERIGVALNLGAMPESTKGKDIATEKSSVLDNSEVVETEPESTLKEVVVPKDRPKNDSPMSVVESILNILDEY